MPEGTLTTEELLTGKKGELESIEADTVADKETLKILLNRLDALDKGEDPDADPSKTPPLPPRPPSLDPTDFEKARKLAEQKLADARASAAANKNINEQRYKEARQEYWSTLYAEKREELDKLGIPLTAVEAELDKFMATEIYNKIGQENNDFHSLEPKKSNYLKKFWSWYTSDDKGLWKKSKMAWMGRKLAKITTTTAMGTATLGAMSTVGIGAGIGGAAAVGWRWGRAGVTALGLSPVTKKAIGAMNKGLDSAMNWVVKEGSLGKKKLKKESAGLSVEQKIAQIEQNYKKAAKVEGWVRGTKTGLKIASMFAVGYGVSFIANTELKAHGMGSAEEVSKAQAWNQRIFGHGGTAPTEHVKGTTVAPKDTASADKKSWWPWKKDSTNVSSNDTAKNINQTKMATDSSAVEQKSDSSQVIQKNDSTLASKDTTVSKNIVSGAGKTDSTLNKGAAPEKSDSTNVGNKNGTPIEKSDSTSAGNKNAAPAGGDNKTQDATKGGTTSDAKTPEGKGVVSPAGKGVTTEFKMTLGQNGVPAEAERVFSSIALDQMEIKDGAFTIADGAKALNISQNLLELFKGHNIMDVKASDLAAAAHFDPATGQFEVTDHAKFNAVVGKLEGIADKAWDQGVLQTGAEHFVGKVTNQGWEKILHAEHLDKVGDVDTGITGHDDIKTITGDLHVKGDLSHVTGSGSGTVPPTTETMAGAVPPPGSAGNIMHASVTSSMNGPVPNGAVPGVIDTIHQGGGTGPIVEDATAVADGSGVLTASGIDSATNVEIGNFLSHGAGHVDFTGMAPTQIDRVLEVAATNHIPIDLSGLSSTELDRVLNTGVEKTLHDMAAQAYGNTLADNRADGWEKIFKDNNTDQILAHKGAIEQLKILPWAENMLGGEDAVKAHGGDNFWKLLQEAKLAQIQTGK